MTTDGLMMPPGGGRLISGGALHATLKIAGGTAALASTFEVVVPPGYDVGAHVHTRGEELFYVVDGELDLLAFEPVVRSVGDRHEWTSRSGTKFMHGGPGSFMFVPAGCPHAFGNPTNKPATMLFQSAPSGHERRWNQTAEPVPVTGQVNLRGLAPLAVAELLYGLQQRAAAEVTSYCRFLRRLAQELRQTQVPSLTELPVQDEPARRSLANSLVTHLGRAFADPRTEIAKDRWDLTVLGHHGWLTFTGISQDWLREAAKGWAAHDLPRRRGKQAGARLNEVIGALVRLSAALRAGRPDQGGNPAGLGRADIEAFLHRMAFLSAGGQLSAYSRVKT